VDAINRTLSMAMGGFKLGDVKQGSLLDPMYIVLQIPLAVRAQISSLSDLPVPSQAGNTVPLAELGRFVRAMEDPVIYHKDLRPVEYVVADTQGRLGAPIYGMFEVEDLLADYVAPDGVKLVSEYLGPPSSDCCSAFEWTGEWTVSYETFRDMGLAFGAALVLIYVLVVWEFGNFLIPAIIMAPIPLTLIGIIPGHWVLGAEFTATSMIGFIALAGIIVRNSILLVDFSIQEVQGGTSVQDAVILSCKTRTRPIVITALALVLGSSVILFDPIFQGMAISLLFGVLVSTVLTLVVIPLGCMSARSAICPADAGASACDVDVDEYKPGLLMRLWSGTITVVQMLFYMVRGLFLLIGSMFGNLVRRAQPEPAVAAATAAAGPVATPPPPPPVSEPTEERGDTGSVVESADAAVVSPESTVKDVPQQQVAQAVETPPPSTVVDESPTGEGVSDTTAGSGAAPESVDVIGEAPAVEAPKPVAKKAVAPKKRVPAKKAAATEKSGVGGGEAPKTPAKKKAPVKKKGDRRGIRLKSLPPSTEGGGEGEGGV